MLNLLGEHHCKVDAKGRMMFPVKLRKQLEQEIHHGLVINRNLFLKCLTLYPKSEWDRVQQEMKLLSRYNEKHQKFMIKFLGGATTLELDDAGRLLLPAALLDHAQIDLKKNNEIVITGIGEQMNLWSSGNYKKMMAEQSDEDFSTLAGEIDEFIQTKQKNS
ncbi:MAG: division/cell wall cluster transcriptional repressor MraZ [Flavobacteriales bacterium]|nr:division/cell wall cluster transcriptional repressor MraZ [Flavobacteriales bacterium]